MIYILLIILFFYLMLNYFLCQKDILAAPVIVTVTFLFGTFCALANNKLWGIGLSVDTVIIISLGIISFTLGYIAVKQKRINTSSIFANSIDIENWKSIILIFYGAITIVLYYSEVKRMASAYGYTGGFSMMMSAFSAVTKYKTTLGANIDGMSGIVNVLYKGLTAIAYMYLYLFVRLVSLPKKVPKKKSKVIIYVLPIAEFVFCTICSASRLAILKLFVAGALLYFIFKNADNGWRKVDLSSYKNIIIGILVVAFLFSYTRGLVGRNNSLDPFSYITAYAGGPIELLDLYIKDPNGATDLIGQETFSAIYSLLYKITNNPIFNYSVHKEFRNAVTGVTVGNVYTAFRAYYNDFGLLGVLIIPGFIGNFYALLYKRVRQRTSRYPINFNVLLYVYFSAGFVFMFIDDLFCSTILGANSIIMIIMFYMLNVFLFKLRIKIK